VGKERNWHWDWQKRAILVLRREFWVQGAAIGLKESLAVEEQSNRAIIQEADVHVGLEGAGLDIDSEASEFGGDGLIEWHGGFGAGCIDEAWASAFAAVTVEGELADEEHAAGDIGESEVHFSFGIFEDAESGNF
jgi:hypothetical protein